ncbi:MAG: hypothetical protein RMJ51_03635 [Candidatus Calescibacterium sp.]|nr:hypothetical protein [Candidatus Calescibacterium sp.]MDW8195317.1 hypothetical protein [Candidatus Calescibacterium sp.]
MKNLKILMIMNKVHNISTIILIIILQLLWVSFPEKIQTAEGSIQYIGKPTSYSPAFILLSSSQRFYIDQEIYNRITISQIHNKHLYFILHNNKVIDFSEKIPKNYTYSFPEIMRIDKFEFDNYLAYYIIWYFGFSPFVEIIALEKGVELFYTSPNSMTVKVPKKYKKNITLIATYKNEHITQKMKYTISLR